MKFLKIADLVIKIDNGDVALHKEIKDFELINYDSDIKADIEIEVTKNPMNYQGRPLVSNEVLSICENEEEYIVSYTKPWFVYGYKLSKSENKAIVFVDRWGIGLCDTENVRLEKDVVNEKNAGELLLYSIRDVIFSLAQRFGRIAVHSASVVYKNKVFLFSAPTGVGKSTHAEQWIKAGIPCKIFNGDVCMLYEKNGKIMAAGLPWSGTSETYSIKDEELGGYFELNRAEKNYVMEMGFADAALSMNARALTPNWNREVLELNISACETIVPKIILGKLFCTPDIEAALVCKQYVDLKLSGE